MDLLFGSGGSRWSRVFRATGALALAALTAAASAQTEPNAPLDFLRKDGRFTFFVKLLNRSGASTWLLHAPTNDTTLFAPTDDAFTHLPQSVIEDLQNNPEALKWAIHYHIVTSRITSASLRLGPKTLTGETLSLTGGMPARTARIVESHSAGDMIVDVVNEVLISPEALRLLQRDGAVPISMGLPPSAPMSAKDVNSFDPTYVPPVTPPPTATNFGYAPSPYDYYYSDPALFYEYMLWGSPAQRYGPRGGTGLHQSPASPQTQGPAPHQPPSEPPPRPPKNPPGG